MHCSACSLLPWPAPRFIANNCALMLHFPKADNRFQSVKKAYSIFHRAGIVK